MFTYIFGIFLIIWEIFCYQIFIGVFAKKRKTLKSKYRYMLLLVLMWINYGIAVIFVKEFFVKQVLLILLSSIIMWFCFKKSYQKILILTILFQGINLAGDYVAITVLNKCFPEIILEVRPFVSSLISAASKMIIFLIVLWVKKNIGTKSSDVLTNTEWRRFSILPVFTIIIIVAIITNFEVISNPKQEDVLLCMAGGLLSMNLFVLYMLNDIMRRETQIREDYIFKEKVKNETKMYRSISENYDMKCKRAHEYKNQMDYILALAQSENYEELNRFLKKNCHKMRSDSNLIDTNNVIVNAILNTKYIEAKEKGILFILKVNDLVDLKLDDEDFVVILSNLLNNAIEACEKCENKIIKLKFIREKSNTIISVINSMEVVPKIVDGKLQSSKEDRQEHGYGIEHIIQTVLKYNGFYTIKQEGNYFHFTILIPNME